MDLPADLLTVPEAAHLLRCDKGTVRRWILSKKIGARRLGKRYLVSRAELCAAAKNVGRPAGEPVEADVKRRALAAEARLRAKGFRFG